MKNKLFYVIIQFTIDNQYYAINHLENFSILSYIFLFFFCVFIPQINGLQFLCSFSIHLKFTNFVRTLLSAEEDEIVGFNA
jgi:hypothetical protein